MKTFEDTVIEVRQTHDIASILGTSKRKLVCPLPNHIHHDNSPSFSIYYDRVTRSQYFKCHGNCGLSGDVIDLVGYLHISGYDKSMALRRRAIEYLDVRFEQQKIVIPEARKLSNNAWTKYLPISEDAKWYALMRGISGETIKKFKLGSKGDWLSMPYFEDQTLVGIKLRNLNPRNDKDRFQAAKGSRQGLFNFDAVACKTGKIFVSKGEIPCMIIDQLGYPVCAPTCGEGGWRDWPAMLSMSETIVIGDNDINGRRMGQIRADILKAKLVFPPDPFKDWDEIYVKDKELSLDLLRQWYE